MPAPVRSASASPRPGHGSLVFAGFGALVFGPDHHSPGGYDGGGPGRPGGDERPIAGHRLFDEERQGEEGHAGADHAPQNAFHHGRGDAGHHEQDQGDDQADEDPAVGLLAIVLAATIIGLARWRPRRTRRPRR